MSLGKSVLLLGGPEHMQTVHIDINHNQYACCVQNVRGDVFEAGEIKKETYLQFGPLKRVFIANSFDQDDAEKIINELIYRGLRA